MKEPVRFYRVAKFYQMLFLSLLYAVVITSSLQAQNLIFAKGLQNAVPLGDNVAGQSIFADNAGNTYVAGTFYANADFDPGAGKVDLTSNANSSDIFIAKYNASGSYQYAKRLGGPNEDVVVDIAVDVSGNVYITGYFSGTADFDPGAGIVALTSSGGEDMFIAKYDASGNYLFAKAFGNSGNDNANSIALDGLGNIYVTGSFSGMVDFDPGAGIATLTATGDEDIFIARYDPSGNYGYAKAMEGSSMSVSAGNDIVVDGSGNIYITGYFEDIVDFDPGAAVATLISAGEADVFIAKHDAMGNYVYAKRIGGTDDDSGAGIGIDASGNVYVTGFFTGTADFDPGAGTTNLTSAGFTDIFVAGYDASGNYAYANRFGSTSLDFGRDIAVDATGNTYVTGHFDGTVDFDPSNGSAALTTAGGDDVLIARYDASGNYVYAKAVGGGGIDNGNSIAINGSGNAYVTGIFGFTADFDPGAGTATLTIQGNKLNAFVCGFTNTGNYIQAIQLGRYSDILISDLGYAVAVDASGNTYITGFFADTVDFDPGVGTANLISAGGRDIYIAKYDPLGNYVYAKPIQGAGGVGNAGFGIAVDGTGNVYITGYFSGTVDFDPGVGTVNLSSAGGRDIFIARYDPSGNYVYAKAIAGLSGLQDTGFGIAIDGSGNAYITGDFEGTADFDPGAGTANLTSAGGKDIFIAKYDVSGNYVYAKALGGTSHEQCFGIALDGLGNVHVTGYINGNADFDPGSGTVILTSAGEEKIFIAKYDASGNYVYAKAIGDSNPRGNSGYGVAVDNMGSAYITGYFTGTADFDPGAGIANLVSAGREDIFIAKYDVSGNFEYAKAMGGTDGQVSYGIAVDALRNVYITGYFTGTTDFDPGTGTSIITNEGDQEIFLAKYDPFGNYVYVKAAGGTGGGGYGNSIAVDGPGNVYVTGAFLNTVDFDPGTGSASSIITAPNFYDIYIARYNTSGSLPVELLDFTAKLIQNKQAVQVNWSTASQTNNAYFEVERSKDGIRFELIGRVQGCLNCTGARQYELNDNNPYSGFSYYRLKQVDLDGKFSYSNVAFVDMAEIVKSVMQVYPNITDGAYTVKIKNNGAKRQAIIQLINAEGRSIHLQTIQLNEGNNTFDYSLSEQIPGVYYIRLTDKLTNTAYTLRLIKK